MTKEEKQKAVTGETQQQSSSETKLPTGAPYKASEELWDAAIQTVETTDENVHSGDKELRSSKPVDDISIGISTGDARRTIEVLREILSDQHVLYLKTRNFHWNLKGPRFHDLHKFFEELYQQLEVAIDETAERIRKLGGISPGSMAEFLEKAHLKECGGNLYEGEEAITCLVSDHEAVIRDLRKKIPMCEGDYNDVGTADFLTRLLQNHEKTAWMLRSQS